MVWTVLFIFNVSEQNFHLRSDVTLLAAQQPIVQAFLYLAVKQYLLVLDGRAVTVHCTVRRDAYYNTVVTQM